MLPIKARNKEIAARSGVRGAGPNLAAPLLMIFRGD
jgi:hypothetical protein